MIVLRICIGKSKNIRRIEEGLNTIILADDQKMTIKARFLGMLSEYEGRAKKYSFSFNSLRLIITVGSLIVPALLSVQYTAGNVSSASANISANVYWCVWCLSLLVTISNGITTLLKVDKKYFILNTTYQLMMSIGWQYIHLSGKFNTIQPLFPPSTHQNQFVNFCNTLEKIRMKQIEDEYYKSGEQHTPSVGDNNHPSPATRLPFSQSFEEKSSPIVNGGYLSSPTTTVSRQRASLPFNASQIRIPAQAENQENSGPLFSIAEEGGSDERV